MARKSKPTPFLDAARKGGRAGVRLDGMEDLEAALRNLSEDTQGEALRGAVDAGAEIMRDVAGQIAPRSFDGAFGHPAGFLSKNIRKERQWTRTQDKAVTDVGMERWHAFYGRFPELGTSHMPAEPFLRPAFDQTKNSVVDEVAEQLRRRILGEG